MAGLLAMLTLSGCATSAPSGGAPVTTTTTTTGVNLPPRLKNLSLRDVDPCALLTTAQLDQLKENGAPRLVDRASWRDGPTCAFDVDAAAPTYTYYLETIPNYDLEDWLAGTHRKTSLTREPATVPGFPALVSYAPGAGIRDCETLVGVADGETLRAEIAPDDETFSQQQLCAMSTTVAKLAVETLETLK